MEKKEKREFECFCGYKCDTLSRIKGHLGRKNKCCDEVLDEKIRERVLGKEIHNEEQKVEKEECEEKVENTNKSERERRIEELAIMFYNEQDNGIKAPINVREELTKLGIKFMSEEIINRYVMEVILRQLFAIRE